RAGEGIEDGAGDWLERWAPVFLAMSAARNPASRKHLLVDSRHPGAIEVVLSGCVVPSDHRAVAVGRRLHVLRLHHPPPRCPALRATAALGGASRDAAARQLLGEGGEVGLWVGLSGDRPDRAQVAASGRIASSHTAAVVFPGPTIELRAI